MLSEDDLNLRDMTPEELDAAWDLWFDLARETDEFDFAEDALAPTAAAIPARLISGATR